MHRLVYCHQYTHSSTRLVACFIYSQCDLYPEVFTVNLRSVYMSTMVNVPIVLHCWRWLGRYRLFRLTQEPMSLFDARLASQRSAQRFSGSNASAHSCACKYSVYGIHEAPPSFRSCKAHNIRKITKLITKCTETKSEKDGSKSE